MTDDRNGRPGAASHAARSESHAASDGQRPAVHVLVVAGSMREQSLNKRLARLVSEVVTSLDATAELAGLQDFDAPSYNHDDEQSTGIPHGPTALRNRLRACEALCLVSPEHNGAVPGGLKNTIDWVSQFRPQPFKGKHCMLFSASPSMGGGNRGRSSLRVPREHLGARVWPDMFSLTQAHTAMTEHGKLVSDSLHARLVTVVGSFLNAVEATKHCPCARKAWIEFPREVPTLATSRAE